MIYPGLFRKFAKKLDYVLPIMFYYDHQDLLRQKSITEKIKKFYFDNKLSKNKFRNITNVNMYSNWNRINSNEKWFQLFGDGWYMHPVAEFTRLRLAHDEDAPTFVYLFTHRGQASFTEGADPDNYYGINPNLIALQITSKRAEHYSFV